MLPTRQLQYFEGNSSVHSIAAHYNSTVSSLFSPCLRAATSATVSRIQHRRRAVDALQPRLSPLEVNLRASFETFDAVLEYTATTIVNSVRVSILFYGCRPVLASKREPPCPQQCVQARLKVCFICPNCAIFARGWLIQHCGQHT